MTNLGLLNMLATSYNPNDLVDKVLAQEIIKLRIRFTNLRLDQMRGVTDDFSYDYDTDTFTISNKINNE